LLQIANSNAYNNVYREKLRKIDWSRMKKIDTRLQGSVLPTLTPITTYIGKN